MGIPFKGNHLRHFISIASLVALSNVLQLQCKVGYIFQMLIKLGILQAIGGVRWFVLHKPLQNNSVPGMHLIRYTAQICMVIESTLQKNYRSQNMLQKESPAVIKTVMAMLNPCYTMFFPMVQL